MLIDLQPRTHARALVFSLLVTVSFARVCCAANEVFDVVVYGATASGVMAAIGAAQEGARVGLLEPGRHVGGMLSGGLSNSDVDNQEQLIGGLARSFFVSAGQHYRQPIAWAFEPHVAEEILLGMLSNAHVSTYFDCRLSSVVKAGSQLTLIRMENGREFSGHVFIDSSYEGDLMKAAGVSYAIGREARTRYGESLAGRQDILPGHHQFKFPVSADMPSGGLLPLIVPESKVAQIGEGDNRFQSYCFRLCMTEDPANSLPVERPKDYHPSRYELARRYLESARGALFLNDFLGIVPIPNSKYDVNSTGPVSTDLLGASWEYPEANYARRKQIWNEHLSWAQGLIYFLQNDTSVPENIRLQIRKWGLPKDEFLDTGHWPNQLYVREGRRMLGEFVLTQHDLEEYRQKYDSIGMAGYNIDIREVEWLVHKVYLYPKVVDQVFTEGYLSMPVQPWQIPYRALLPRQEECSNLLVSVCISASTIAYGSFRMEANYMIAGQSAGVAAALAVKAHRQIHLVDVSSLQNTLVKNKQILSMNDVQTQRQPRAAGTRGFSQPVLPQTAGRGR
ncbi:MAG: FAD-dependent oxidoreductase [Acidobacteriota bacterium]|nr:FAD-dependent oxidoreductase [Acidobacteriota bacterium]